jgi:hypothetical protein
MIGAHEYRPLMQPLELLASVAQSGELRPSLQAQRPRSPIRGDLGVELVEQRVIGAYNSCRSDHGQEGLSMGGAFAARCRQFAATGGMFTAQ